MGVTKLWNGEQFVISDSGNVTQSPSEGIPTSEYLLKANNLSDLPNRDLARRNLGIVISFVPPTSPNVNDLWIDLS